MPIRPIEFEKRHGDNAIWIDEEQRRLFADGACIRHNGSGMPDTYFEPHTDKRLLLEQKRIYYERLIARVWEDFRHLKATVTGVCYQDERGNMKGAVVSADGRNTGATPFSGWDEKLYGPAPQRNAERLFRIKGLHDRARTKLDEIDREYETLPEIKEQRRKEAENRHWDRVIALQREAQIREAESITL